MSSATWKVVERLTVAWKTSLVNIQKEKIGHKRGVQIVQARLSLWLDCQGPTVAVVSAGNSCFMD